MNYFKMKVCVVGCGASGLASIKSCLEQGLEVTAYEQDDSIGGVWYYTEEIRENQGAASYQRLVSNSSKETICYSDFPFPDDTSQYITNEHAHKYFKDYATHFDLWPHIQLETQVVNVKRSRDYQKTGKWMVTTKKHGSENNTETVFDAVMISTGYYRRPSIPDLPGLDKFPGKVTTAAAFRKGEVFTDQNVLVVGNAFSAGDMATEIAHFAKKVYLAVGSGTWVIPYNIAGNIPADCIGSRHVTYWKYKTMTESVYELCNAHIDHIQTGLAGEKGPGEAGYMVNDEIGFLINSGKITVKGHVERIQGNSVIFSDQSTIGPIEHILFATGYHTEVPFLEKGILGEKREDFRLYKHIFQVDLEHPTLAFIGHFPHLGPSWALFELQARWASGVFAGTYTLPDVELMRKEVALVGPETAKQLGRDLLYPVSYSDFITKMIGCRPRILRYILTDPVLAYACWFGPMFSAQYRLEGPHSCPDARERFLNGINKTITAPKARKFVPFVVSKQKKKIILQISGACLTLAIGLLMVSKYIDVKSLLI